MTKIKRYFEVVMSREKYLSPQDRQIDKYGTRVVLRVLLFPFMWGGPLGAIITAMAAIVLYLLWKFFTG